MAYVSLKSEDGLVNLYYDLDLGTDETTIGFRLRNYEPFKTIGDVALLEDTQASLGFHFQRLYPEWVEAFVADPNDVIHSKEWTQLKSLVVHARELAKQAAKNRYEYEAKEDGVPVSHIGKKTSEVSSTYGFLVLEDQTPGQKIWRILSNQIERKNLHFVPWVKWVSLEDERRAIPTDSSRRLRLTDKNDLEIVENDETNSSLRGFARINQICMMRKVLYVAENLCKPASIDFWTQKLLKAFHPQRLQPSTRAPQFKELEEADRIFWSEVFRLASAQNSLILDTFMNVAMNYTEVTDELKPRIQVDQSKNSKPNASGSNIGKPQQPPKASPKPPKGGGKGSKNVWKATPKAKQEGPSKAALKNRRRREKKREYAASVPVKQEPAKVRLEPFFPHKNKYDCKTSHILEVYDGANVRELRDGGGILSPGVMNPEFRKQSTFWEKCLSVIDKIAKNVFENSSISSPSMLFEKCDVIAAHRSFFAESLSSENAKISTEILWPQPFCLNLVRFLAAASDDEDKAFLNDLQSGKTIGFKKDLGSNLRVFPPRRKHRDYDPAKPFRGNYPSATENFEALENEISKEVNLGRMKGPFSKEELLDHWPDAKVCAVGVELKDLRDKTKIRVLVDATQGGVNQEINLTMAPTRPGLVDVLRVLEFFVDPVSIKWDASSAHRNILVPFDEWGLVTICLEETKFFVNTVGTFGVASAGQNWDRVAAFVHRSCLRLLGTKKLFMFLFSDDTFLICERHDRDKILRRLFTFLTIIGYPLSLKKFWFEENCLWLGFEVNLHERSARIFEIKRLFTNEKLGKIKKI